MSLNHLNLEQEHRELRYALEFELLFVPFFFVFVKMYWFLFCNWNGTERTEMRILSTESEKHRALLSQLSKGS